MKYQVQIKYTNPSHEHVSLRRRVDMVTRLVEASSEEEAINRAANQQRALGFKIQEALVVQPLNEGFDPDPKDIAAHLVGKHGKGKVTKDHVDAYERGRDSNRAIDKEAVMKHVQKMSEEVESVNEDQAADMQKIQSMDKGSMVGGKTELKTHLKYLNAMHTHQKKYGLDTAKTKKKIGDVSRSLVQMGEEVEQVDERNKENADRRKMMDAERGAKFKSQGHYTPAPTPKQNDDEAHSKMVGRAIRKMTREEVVDEKTLTKAEMKKRFAAGGLANKAMMRTINPTGVNTGITRGGGNKAYRKITGKAPPHQLTKKTGVSEEVVTEASKEGKDVMRGMRASLKSMDLRHGVDSDKRVSGYKMSPAVKAAQAKSDALSKKVKSPQAGTLAAVHKSMEREMMKKEAADPGSMKVVNKKVKAAEKMINAAKGKVNKVNMKPTVELEKYKD